MCRACHSVSARVVWTTAALAASICAVEAALAQQPARQFRSDPMYATAGAAAQANMTAPASYAQPAQPMPRGPLARLVANPDRSGGLPPFALADQSGAIQRYVEPVPGIDLRPHLGQVVVVRHDTGRTLLASQLELPSPPLYPMVGGVAERLAAGAAPHSSRPATGPRQERFVQLAQYADDDDTTVELFDEDYEPLPDGGPTSHAPRTNGNPVVPEGVDPMSGHMVPGYPGDGFPMFPDSMPHGYGGPMPCEADGMEWPPGEGGMAPCPQCGRYHGTSGHEMGMGYVSGGGQAKGRGAHAFADVEINFLRLHLPESAVGKLSEKYAFSPRFIVGFTGIGPIDGRARYWLYGRQTETIGDDETSIRMEFDVLDLEGTHRFCGQRSEVTLAAGLRLARIELVNEETDAAAGTDLLGMTLAADGRTRLASLEAGRLAWVYGGRLSILGGDWGGEDGGFLESRVRDDNVVCHELYAGLELARCYRQLDLRCRLAFELQNWRSDVLAASDATNIESIGIVGPSLRIGAEF